MQDEIIKLNIGGIRFETTRTTLTRIPDTYFTSLLSGRLVIKYDSNGAIFIDRDGCYFAPILTFLRTSRIPKLINMNYDDLLFEAEFFSIQPLVQQIQIIFKKNKERFKNSRNFNNINQDYEEIEDNRLPENLSKSYGNAVELYSKIDNSWKLQPQEANDLEILVVNSLAIFSFQYGVLQATIIFEEVPHGHLGPQQPNAVTVQRGRGIIRVFSEKVNAILCEQLAKRFEKVGFKIGCELPKQDNAAFSIHLDWSTTKWL
eukprot:TRINITY_DN6019_c0_g1_i1.p1 TRINITY_DN6019_c0_g1~~TRINITY_DN6019_c0_g1_i1.p1  ORF type:complete len:260 (-),score=96.98 TRINITY_DN6019_c0_g1_i1:193-972(-)